MPKRQRPRSILRLKVKGAHIHPGRIPIPYLLQICEEAQNAINRQAESIKGRKSLKPGPVTGDVLEECTLELFAIGKGSAVMSFAAPEPPSSAQATLDLPPQEGLSEKAVLGVVRSIADIKRNKVEQVKEGVLRSLQVMGGILNNGISSIDWIVPKSGERKRTVAVFDQEVVRRIQPPPEKPSYNERTIRDGRLEMADFKIDDLKCMILTSDGNRTVCSFSEEMSDRVHRALRHLVRIAGVGTFNARTKRLESVVLDDVNVLDPSMFGAESFFARTSLSDLALAQGVRAGNRIPRSRDDETDEEIEAFVERIYRSRS